MIRSAYQPRRAAVLASLAGILGLSAGLSPAAAAPAIAHLHPASAKAGAKTTAKVIHYYGQDYVVSKHCDGPPQLPNAVHYADPSDFRLQVFLNFDGQALTKGPSNGPNNTTGLIVASSHDYPAMIWGSYGGKEKGIKDTIEELKLLYGDIAVEFVTTRPETGDYTMIMVGGNGQGLSNPTGSTIGIAPLDCKNSNPNDLGVVFGAKITPSAKNLAYVIAHELGHTFGLEHVTDQKGIMFPALTGTTCCWASGPLDKPPGTCGRGGQQDSLDVLKKNVGVGDGDLIPPKLWFVRPGTGAILPGTFAVEVTAGDDLRVHHVTLYLDGKQIAEVSQPPFVVRVEGVADGEHTLKAEVFDFKPNSVTAEQTVTVDSKCILDGRCNGGVPGAGSTCKTGGDCGTGVCALKNGAGTCVQKCEDATSVCPEGTDCVQAGEQWACTKSKGFTLDVFSGSGGCAVATGQSSGAGSGIALVFGLLALLMLRRRSRKNLP